MNNNYFKNAELPGLIREKNTNGTNLLYKQYAHILFGVISAIIADKVDSEKVLHQTFDNICTEIAAYDASNSSFLTWAMQVARNTSIAYLRSAKQVQQPGYLVQTNSAAAQIELILLPNVDAEPTGHHILAMVLQGCKAHEVAEKLNMTVDAVKMQIRKAMLSRANRI